MLAAAADPVVERRAADLQDPAQETDGIGDLLRGDEPVDLLAGHRSASRSKTTAAFRRTYFSNPSSATRRGSLANSARSSPLTAAGPSRRFFRRCSTSCAGSRGSPQLAGHIPNRPATVQGQVGGVAAELLRVLCFDARSGVLLLGYCKVWRCPASGGHFIGPESKNRTHASSKHSATRSPSNPPPDHPARPPTRQPTPPEPDDPLARPGHHFRIRARGNRRRRRVRCR
jgi:hypothetical protein